MSQRPPSQRLCFESITWLHSTKTGFSRSINQTRFGAKEINKFSPSATLDDEVDEDVDGDNDDDVDDDGDVDRSNKSHNSNSYINTCTSQFLFN